MSTEKAAKEETPGIVEKARALFVPLIRAILAPSPKIDICDLLERHVVVPLIVGSPFPGPLNMGHMPQWRGLLRRLAHRRCRFFVLMKSARIGGTLFLGICIFIWKIITRPGPMLWVEPTRKTGGRFSRQELQPFLRECPPVAAQIIDDKKHWTTWEMILRTCTLGVVGAGSVADLGGRQAECLIINEEDKLDGRARAEAPPGLLAQVRTKLFPWTRKIVRNSTPTLEAGNIFGGWREGDQLHQYFTCPDCRGHQRFTFFKEPEAPDKWFRIERGFDDVDDPIFRGEDTAALEKEIKKLSADVWLVRGIPGTGRVHWPATCQDKRSKVWNVDEVERVAKYECVFCQALLAFDRLNELNRGYSWRGHKPATRADTRSAHIHALTSPMDLGWGGLAKKYLSSLGNVSKMHDFYNSDLGLPFERTPTRITRKAIELLQSKSPRYERQNPQDPEAALDLPIRPAFITMHVDVQQTGFYFTQIAWSVDGAAYLLAWGAVVSFPEIIDISNRQWRYDFGPTVPERVRYEMHRTWMGLMDGGYKAKRTNGVYRFVHEQSGTGENGADRWTVTKGGAYQSSKEKPIHETTIAFNYDGREVDIPFIHYNDDQMKEHLYRFVIKESAHALYLPVNLDEPFLEQITSEYLAEILLRDGRRAYEWKVGVDPHYGDCTKLGEIFRFLLSPEILVKRRAAQDTERNAILHGDDLTAVA